MFTETFGPFFFADRDDMAEFRKHHAELMTPEWWKNTKEHILAGGQADIFPYSERARFSKRYADDG